MIAHKLRNVGKFALPRRVPSPIEWCQVRPHTALNPGAVFIVRGLYMPSWKTRRLTHEGSESLCAPMQHPDASAAVTRILTGDLFVRTWGPLCEEWCPQGGMWERNDPTGPTCSTGSTIDRMLFLPGKYIPPTFTLPVSSNEVPEEASGSGRFPPSHCRMRLPATLSFNVIQSCRGEPSHSCGEKILLR